MLPNLRYRYAFFTCSITICKLWYVSEIAPFQDHVGSCVYAKFSAFLYSIVIFFRLRGQFLAHHSHGLSCSGHGAGQFIQFKGRHRLKKIGLVFIKKRPFN